MLRPVPVKLHDSNSERERCDAEAEGFELDIHGAELDDIQSICVPNEYFVELCVF
jgi:hypothetical protein